MLTYNLEKTPGVALYEALYRAVRDDILNGKLKAGDRLPSKRMLADHLQVSKVTVENAYAQLEAEGYIYAKDRAGFFVDDVERVSGPQSCPAEEAGQQAEREAAEVDFTYHNIDAARFPFSVWSRLMREVIAEKGERLLSPLPSNGVLELREAICGYLYRMRGLSASPEQVIVGAGTDYLYQLIIQLLGRDKRYAAGTPGYLKSRSVFKAGGVKLADVGMDGCGVITAELAGADVLHISPSHHFPTGIVTPVGRRQELLSWVAAGEGRYILEDDYDSEFRFVGRPIPTLMSMDASGRVIYLNTFSKSIAPSIRISYMVLPRGLVPVYCEKLGFYSSTVSSFEQYTLERFISGGYFEKHLARMKKYYRTERDKLTDLISASEFANRVEIMEENAGLHFLLRVKTGMTDRGLKAFCQSCGIRINCLSDYFPEASESAATHILVVNYSGVTEVAARKAIDEISRRLK